MSMIHDVIAATYRGGYRIELEFDDGERGVVDFKSMSKKAASLNDSGTWSFSEVSRSTRNWAP